MSNVIGGNSTIGTISSAGLYSAPSVPPSPYTVNVTATSVGDTSKSASTAILIAGTIASVSQTISASAGGTITLPDGSSVTIAPGTLPANLNATLSKVSYLTNQPSNPAIQTVGPGLVLTFEKPVQFLARKGSDARLVTLPAAQPRPAVSSVFHFVISTAQNDSALLVASVPAANLVSSAAKATFIGGVGAYNATVHTITADFAEGTLAAETATNSITSMAVSAVNFVAANIRIVTDPGKLTLNVNATNSLQDTWGSYSACPTGKTLLVVHGMLTAVENTFTTSDHTVQDIQLFGGYKSVVGFNYDWTQAVDTSGAQLAAFLFTLAQCPGVSIDIEAHSEGVPVTLSALTDITASTRQQIQRVIAVAGPIMGTPMANDSTYLSAYMMSQPFISLPANLASIGIADLLALPFVHDLQISSPGSNDKLDLIRRTVAPYSINNAPQIYVVAGDLPDSMQTFALLMTAYSVNYSDGFIPLSSAFAFQDNSGNLPVMKVYPLLPFATNHTGMIGNGSVISGVAAQVNNSPTPPSLTFSSSPP